MENNYTTFEEFLRDMFIQQNEFGGIPITKDNCEDLFDTYLENLDGEEYLRLGTAFGKIQFIQGERNQIKEEIKRINKIKKQIYS